VDSAIPSPNDQWLLLQSYGGKPHWDIWAGNMPSSGPFSLEVFAIPSVNKILEIHGNFRNGLDPSFVLGENGWLTDNVLAFAPYPSKNKIVICDVSKTQK
jgi:hypothetical protein